MRRTAAAAIALTAGLAIGASACGSDDDTPNDDVDLETPLDTVFDDGVTDTLGG